MTDLLTGCIYGANGSVGVACDWERGDAKLTVKGAIAFDMVRIVRANS